MGSFFWCICDEGSRGLGLGHVVRAVDYGLEKMNGKVSRWMRGDLLPSGEPVPMPFIATRGADSIVWSRLYSQEVYASPEDKYMVHSAPPPFPPVAAAATATRPFCACHGVTWSV